nr:MAG TPA: hypothetical protein [Caudoviricetes sp.]
MTKTIWTSKLYNKIRGAIEAPLFLFQATIFSHINSITSNHIRNR